MSPSPLPPDSTGSSPHAAGGPATPVSPAEAPGALVRVCPYCRESVHAHAERCRHCQSYLSEIGRQRALREWLSSAGLPNVDVGRPGCLGLTLPGAALFAVAAYFGAQGAFALMARQPALLQAAVGAAGAILALAFFRVRRKD
jgi:hypothetical protein